MTTRRSVIGLAAALNLVAVSLSSRADEEFLATVIRELPQAAISLQQALKTSESEGHPISAEFDVEDGELRIGVHKPGRAVDEVTIDPKSGSIKGAKPLSDAKEINDAQAQSAALGKSKLPLSAVLNAAVDANFDYRAVSIIPMLGDNEAVARITLLKGDDIKQVTEKLD